jgi:glycosyltransferase involved in cell wall biosynthesis
MVAALASDSTATAAQAEAAHAASLPGVLHLLPELDGGPRSRAVIDMAASIVAGGGRAVIASPPGSAIVDVQRAGALHVPLALDRDNPLVQRSNAARIETLIREHRIRLVHAHGRSAAWSGARAARRCQAAFVGTFHRPYHPGGFFGGSGAKAMAGADAAIAVSEYVRETVIRHFPALADRLAIIPYGLDMDRFDPARVSAERVVHLATQWRLPDGVPVVMAGGLAARKSGHVLLLEALARIAARDFYCLMFAAAEDFESVQREFEELALKLGIGARVHLLEPCRDMPAALMLADVVAVPAAEPEPFSMSIAEAQAMGRPVVAAAHGAAREQMEGQPMAWLVPPGDGTALAAALEAALDLTLVQRQHRSHDAIAGARIRYGRDSVSDALLAIYNRLLPDGTPAAPAAAPAAALTGEG